MTLDNCIFLFLTFLDCASLVLPGQRGWPWTEPPDFFLSVDVNPAQISSGCGAGNWTQACVQARQSLCQPWHPPPPTPFFLCLRQGLSESSLVWTSLSSCLSLKGLDYRHVLLCPEQVVSWQYFLKFSKRLRNTSIPLGKAVKLP